MLYGNNGINEFFSVNLTGVTGTTNYRMSLYDGNELVYSGLPINITYINENYAKYNVQLSSATCNTWYNYVIFNDLNEVERGILHLTGETSLFSGITKSNKKYFVKR